MNIPVDAEFQGLCNGVSHFVEQSTCVELLAQTHNPISAGRHNCMHAMTPSSQIWVYSLKFGFKLALLYGTIQQIGRSCTEYSVVAMIHVRPYLKIGC